MVWVGTFYFRVHSEPHRRFQRRSILKFGLKSENCMIETHVMGLGATGLASAMPNFISV